MSVEATAAAKPKKVWLRAFWGFDPENEGYYGFTKKRDRETFISKSDPGDWVLIYGAVNAETAPEQVRQALGFLELTHHQCADVDRMSDAAIERRDQGSYAHRWNHGVRVSRAWRIISNVHIRNVATDSYSSDLRFPRATMGVLLTDEETERALSYPITPVNVFGEPQLTIPPTISQAAKIFSPSKGLPPSFGEKSSFTEDGENFLYVMEFVGDLALMLPGSAQLAGKQLFKVGRSNSPKRRMSELNAGFPQDSAAKWALKMTHSFPDGMNAHLAEQALLSELSSNSLGNEFFLFGDKAMQSAFTSHCMKHSIVIKGAPGPKKI